MDGDMLTPAPDGMESMGIHQGRSWAVPRYRGAGQTHLYTTGLSPNRAIESREAHRGVLEESLRLALAQRNLHSVHSGLRQGKWMGSIHPNISAPWDEGAEFRERFPLPLPS